MKPIIEYNGLREPNILLGDQEMQDIITTTTINNSCFLVSFFVLPWTFAFLCHNIFIASRYTFLDINFDSFWI